MGGFLFFVLGMVGESDGEWRIDGRWEFLVS